MRPTTAGHQPLRHAMTLGHLTSADAAVMARRERRPGRTPDSDVTTVVGSRHHAHLPLHLPGRPLTTEVGHFSRISAVAVAAAAAGATSLDQQLHLGARS